MKRVFIAAIALASSGSAVRAQQPASPTVGVAAGVDTASARARSVLALWRAYLADRPDSARPSTYWSAADRRRTPDLQLPILFASPTWGSDVRATVVDLAPAVPNDTATYVIRTLFVRADSAGLARVPVLVRAYAVREGAGWALASPAPRLTSDWMHTPVGRIAFVYPSTHSFDAAAAARSAAFVDSAARVLGVAPPASITYYLAGSPREVARVLGVDLAPAAGGRVYADDAILLSAQPVGAEWNAHDLAHVVAEPVAGRAPRFLNEGMAAWLGGWRGRTFAQLVRELDADLTAHPTRTLDSLVAPHAWRDTIGYTGAAVLVRLAAARGPAALARLMAPGDGTPASIAAAAAASLGIAPGRVNDVWRRAVQRWATAP